MELSTKPSIKAYLMKRRYRAELICINNDERVATTSKGYILPEDLRHHLRLSREQMFFAYKQNARGHYFQGHIVYGDELIQVFKSEYYATKQKAKQGSVACINALQHGVMESKSELSDTAHIFYDKDEKVLEVIRGVYT